MTVKLSTAVQENAGTISYKESHDCPDILTLHFPVSLDMVTQWTMDSWLPRASGGGGGGGSSLRTDPTTLPLLNPFLFCLEIQNEASMELAQVIP